MKWTDRLSSLILGEQSSTSSDEAVQQSIKNARRVARATTGRQPSLGLRLLQLAVGDKTNQTKQSK